MCDDLLIHRPAATPASRLLRLFRGLGHGTDERVARRVTGDPGA